MMEWTSHKIRQTFLDYFAEHGHRVVRSSSLIPFGDPTLLFINAGMVQFKDTFLGLEKRDYKRATTAQKCMRVTGKHNDLENVGPSPRHHTFFEMLGNFSFGDYFKKEAIAFAWDLLLNYYGLDVNRLWFTVYEDDDEAEAYWREIGAAPERILRFGKSENFWEMGDTGPCGPCSEIHYYTGEMDKMDASGVNAGDAYIEIWNLVFMQYEKDASGRMTPLPKPSIDTGMGMERLTMILQNAATNYDTDLFMPIMDRLQQIVGDSDVQRRQNYVPYRVIADHGRAMSFLIGDGVLPGNSGRGYILRLLLRRAARFGRTIGLERPFLAEIADSVIAVMGDQYPELKERAEFIKRTITGEEERFSQTLTAGMNILEKQIADLEKSGAKIIPGQAAFTLYDTFGFPLDLTRDVAEEHGLSVDKAGFDAAMTQQRERARAASHFGGEEFERAQRYQELLAELQAAGQLDKEGVQQHIYDGKWELDAEVVALIVDGEPRAQVKKGEKVEIVLDQTPFYVASGGQVSDTGSLSGAGWQARIDDVARPVKGLIVHSGQVTEGTLSVGAAAHAKIDIWRRWNIMRNHTVTHILHNRLRALFGTHVHQAGSLVAPDRMRFDYTHTLAPSPAELAQLEAEVNRAILRDDVVWTEWLSYKEAVSAGAMALFDEKYGDWVRVVSIGQPKPYSRELCGGTHVDHTAQIGYFHIVGEGSVGSGARRLEVVTGEAAAEMASHHLEEIEQLAVHLGVRPAEVADRVLSLLNDLKATQRQVARLQEKLARYRVGDYLKQAVEVDGIPVVAAVVDVPDMNTLRQMTDWLREKLGSAVVVLGCTLNGRPQIVATITPDLVTKGLHAGQIVKVAAVEVGGGGGGRPTLAQAGGRDAEKLPAAMAAIVPFVRQQLAQAS